MGELTPAEIWCMTIFRGVSGSMGAAPVGAVVTMLAIMLPSVNCAPCARSNGEWLR